MFRFRIVNSLFCIIIFIQFLSIKVLSQETKITKLENNTITAIEGISVGHYTDIVNLTGCTVIRFTEEGATAAVDVRGSAPGTRETDLLDPINLVDKVNAIVLSGGSAYGLDAASGVMNCLEKDNIGFPVGNGVVVPIVPAAVLFDLHTGNPNVRPTADWGFQACKEADDSTVEMGNIGAGTGATVGKLLGMDKAMKSGLGSAVIKLPGNFLVGALVAVNAVGDIIDYENGKIIAGIRGDKKDSIKSTVSTLLEQAEEENIFPGTNTTIAVVATNIPLTKTQLKKIAQMAHDGLARVINPAHTMYDGDTIFAVSTTSQQDEKVKVSADTINLVGVAAAEALAKAIIIGVKKAESVIGFPSASDW